MKRMLLVVLLAVSLGGAWVSPGVAGDVGYRFSENQREFAIRSTGPPSSGVMAADALIGRPVGLATTVLGTAAFIVALPMSLGSGSTDQAAWGLVGRPGAWTFVRRMGEGNPRFEERSLFQP